jgi:hypothetical protein
MKFLIVLLLLTNSFSSKCQIISHYDKVVSESLFEKILYKNLALINRTKLKTVDLDKIENDSGYLNYSIQFDTLVMYQMHSDSISSTFKYELKKEVNEYDSLLSWSILIETGEMNEYYELIPIYFDKKLIVFKTICSRRKRLFKRRGFNRAFCEFLIYKLEY